MTENVISPIAGDEDHVLVTLVSTSGRMQLFRQKMSQLITSHPQDTVVHDANLMTVAKSDIKSILSSDKSFIAIFDEDSLAVVGL